MMQKRRRTQVLVAAVTVLVIASGCSRLNAPPVGAVQPVVLPVAARSIPSVYGIQFDLHGSAIVRDGWVYVDIPSGIARTYQGRASAWDLVVRAGIATCSGHDRGGVISEGQAGRIAPLVGLTQDDPDLDTIPRKFVAPLRLDVGIPPGTDLARSWVTLDVAWPVEATIASYALTATGGLSGSAVSTPQSSGATHAPAKQSDVVEMDILHAPPPSVRCAGP